MLSDSLYKFLQYLQPDSIEGIPPSFIDTWSDFYVHCAQARGSAIIERRVHSTTQNLIADPSNNPITLGWDGSAIVAGVFGGGLDAWGGDSVTGTMGYTWKGTQDGRGTQPLAKRFRVTGQFCSPLRTTKYTISTQARVQYMNLEVKNNKYLQSFRHRVERAGDQRGAGADFPAPSRPRLAWVVGNQKKVKEVKKHQSALYPERQGQMTLPFLCTFQTILFSFLNVIALTLCR